MDIGRGQRSKRLSYVGSGMEIDALHEQLIGKKSGRVRPKGHGPDQFEVGD